LSISIPMTLQNGTDDVYSRYLTLVIPIIFVVLYLIKKIYFVDKVGLIYQKTQANQKLIEDSGLHNEKYEYPLWGSSGHVQTFYAQAIRIHRSPLYRREHLIAPDGGLIVLDWVDHSLKNAPIVFIIPGICGSGSSNYIKQYMTLCNERKYNAVLFLPRGVDELRTPRIFTLALNSDIRFALNHIRSSSGDSPIIGVGFSLGGNMLANYLGDCTKLQVETNLIGGVTMAQGFDAVWGIRHLKTAKFYDYGMLRKLKKVLERHQKLFHALVDVQYILTKTTTVEEFDQHFTCKIHGYETANEYYKEQSCIDNLRNITVPYFLINAKDDPLVIEEMLPLNAPSENKNLIMVTTKHGGHLSWAEGFLLPVSYWHERASLNCVAAMLNLWKNKKTE